MQKKSSNKATKVAVMDLGTNTFHLVIAEKTKKGIVELYSESCFVILGKGLMEHGHITPDAAKRAVEAMCQFRKKMDEFDVTQAYAVATSAMRSAVNGEQVIEQMSKEAGITPLIIDGQMEAELIWEGVRSQINIGTQTALVMDIGGGSVEFILCNQDEIFWKRSYEIGAHRLYGQFYKSDPMPTIQQMELQTFLHQRLISLKEAVQIFKPYTLIGSAGSFNTLRDIHAAAYGKPLSTDYQINKDEFLAIMKRIMTKPRAERLKIAGMIEQRVDMMVVSCCLVQFALQVSNVALLRCGTGSLKEGLIKRAFV